MQNYTKGIIYASTTAFFWGFLAIGLKVATRKVEPVTIVWFRFVVAFIMLSAWQAFKDPSSFQILKRPPLLLILAGIALSWNYLGFMLGIHYTTPSNAQIFVQIGQVILAVSGFVIFKEKLKRNQVVGFSVAILGFSFFYRDQLFAFFESQGRYNMGVLLTISAAVSWAVYAILQKKLLTKHPAESLNLFLFGLPVIIFAPFINLAPLFQMHWTWWLLLVFLGANTFVAYSCLAMALKYLEANKASIILILNPMITFITMGLLTKMNVDWITHERFSGTTIIGAALVFFGAILVVWRKNKKLRR